MSFYDVNGTRFSLTSADIDIAGVRILGATGLKIKESLEPGEVEGNSSVARGYTRGKFSGTCGFSLPFGEAVILMSALGRGFGTRIITGSWTFVELQGDGIATVTINGARITSHDFDGGDRTKGTAVTYDLLLTQPCSWNGRSIVEMANQAGFGGSLSLFGL